MRIRLFVAFLGILGLGLIGYRASRYLLETAAPALEVRGIVAGGAYAGTMRGSVVGSHPYKVARLSVWLDGVPLVDGYKVNRSNFEYPLEIPSRETLVDGEHILKVAVVSGAYGHKVQEYELPFFIDNVPLEAAFTVSEPVYKVFQGKTLHVQVQTNKPLKELVVEALGNTYSAVQEGSGNYVYEAFIPVKSDEHPSEYPFVVSVVDRVGGRLQLMGKLQVVLFPFKQQTISLNAEKLKEEAAAGRSEREFEEEMIRIAKQSPQKKLWKGLFYVPCDMKSITTAFGTVRTTQYKGRYRHDAIDLIASPKSVVWASQDGIVALKDRFVHGGNSVVIDHGCGVVSIYFHLDSFADISVGQAIKKGNPVGTLGKTGYATGYHLHWEMRINNTPVDPMEWTQVSF